MVFLTHKTTTLNDGRLVEFVSDESLRGFNVSTIQLFQEGFTKLFPGPESASETEYAFPAMVSEEKAAKKYEELVKQ